MSRWCEVTDCDPGEGVLVLTRTGIRDYQIASRYWDDNGDECWEDNHGSYLDDDFDPEWFMEIEEKS